MQGSTLTCPPGDFTVEKAVPKGYLDGLTCQGTDKAGSIIQVPLSQVVQLEQEDELSGGAIFGIVLAVLVALGGMAGGAWYVNTAGFKNH